MKFQVCMKDPDTLHDAIGEAVRDEIKQLGITDEDEIEALAECRSEKAQEIAAKWFRYGEYLTVEIDTEAQTCTVVPARS